MNTSRLRLRRLAPIDAGPFSQINGDPVAMRFLPKVMSRSESDELLARLIAEDSFFAVLRQEDEVFLGACGLLHRPAHDFKVEFAPCTEIGWRFAPSYWNQGFATEAARAVLEWGFTQRSLKEIVSFTVPANLASRRVMEKIGMRYVPGGDFDHPNLAVNHPLRRHVLYCLDSENCLEVRP